MAKATFPAQSQSVAESTKPADGDGFTPSDHRNAYSALYQGDLGVMRPRAKSPAALAINVAAAELEGFYRNVYWNNNHVKFTGGDSPNFTTPTSNPRIDLLVLDVSGGPTGVLTRVAGTEAASPAEPALPDLKTNIPVCYVYNRVGQTKIVNFEDKDANPTEGYIYRDVRAWVPPGGGTTLGGTPTNSAVGDAAAEGASQNAAKGDHRHGRESAGTPVTQAFGDAPAQGAGPSVAYSNHRHGMPADPAQPRADNLIKNGSFESYTGNVPDNWTRGGTPAASGSGQDTALGQFGDSCDRFTVEPSSTSTLLQSVAGTISASRNAYFRGKTFSLWVRVKNVSGIGNAYFRLGIDDGVSLQEGTEVLLGDDIWTTVEFTAAISANATKLEAVLKFRNGHGSFTSSFRCDGACLVLGSKAAEFLPHWNEAADPHA